MKTRILAFLLALTMILSIAPSAFAAEEVTENSVSADTLPAEPAEPSEQVQITQTEQPVTEQPLAEEPLFALTSVICECGVADCQNPNHTQPANGWTTATTALLGQSSKPDMWLRLDADLTKTGDITVKASDHLHIDLNGHTLTVDTANRVFNIYGGELSVCDSSAAHSGQIVHSGVTINNAAMTAAIFFWQETASNRDSVVNIYGGTYKLDENTQTKPTHGLAYIRNYSGYTTTFNIYGGTFDGLQKGTIPTNSGSGGFTMVKNCAVNVYGGTIQNCIASVGKNENNQRVGGYGGAFYLGGSTCTLTLYGGVVQNCQAACGGAVYVSGGSFIMTGGTISGCSADGIFESNGTSSNSYGGGVYVASCSECALSGGTITNCSASAGGGGIRINANNCRLEGTSFTGNTSHTDGGAVYIAGNATVTMTGGLFTNNHSDYALKDYDIDGISVRVGSTLNISGDVQIYGNTPSAQSSRTAGRNLGAPKPNGVQNGGSIQLNGLTGYGYIVAGTGDLTVQNTQDLIVHEDGNGLMACFAPFSSAPLEIEIQNLNTSYGLREDFGFEIWAKLPQNAPVDRAYIRGLYGKASTDAAGSVSFRESALAFGNCEVFENKSVALYMWGAADLERPLMVQKGTPVKIITVSGKTLKASSAVPINYEVEFTTQIDKDETVSTIATATETIAITDNVAAHSNHCFCGELGCTQTGHTTPAAWTALNNTNKATYFKDVGLTGDHYLYLAEDITVSKALFAGTPATAGNIHLCLNGHTIYASGYSAFRTVNGSLTVCDCGQTGAVEVLNRGNNLSHAAGRVFFYADTGSNAAVPGATTEIFGGTFTYADSCDASTYGLVYITRGGIFKMHGGTFDGKFKKSTVGGGLISAVGAMSTYQMHLIIDGGTLKNGRSTVPGGAIRSGAYETRISSNAEFINNAAPKGNNIAMIAGSFVRDGNADFGAISVQGAAQAALSATDKIQKGNAGTLSGSITFSGVANNTTLSAPGESFTGDDLDFIHLVDSTATMVQVRNGALVAVSSSGTSTIAFQQNAVLTKGYDGRPLAFTADDVTVTGSSGAVTFTYYASADSNDPIPAPSAIGDYYVVASVAADAYHDGASTARTAISITGHDHCVCGGSCALGGHLHDAAAHDWRPVTKQNAADYFTHVNGSNQTDAQNAIAEGDTELYLYLTSDITVSGWISVGRPQQEQNVHLCLNGHTITGYGKQVFRIVHGSLSVCDCKGTGGIQAITCASPAAGRIFFFPDSAVYNVAGGVFPSLDVYGGTFTYGDSCNPSAHGLVYANYHAKVRIYGGTFDGKQKQSSDGAGLITVGNSTEELKIYGGTFQNGSAATKGGAICSGAATTYISGAQFTNNTAPKGVNIALTAGSFSKGTANYEAISVQGTASAQLKNGDLIEKNGTISDSAAFTFENIPINTYLSPEGTNFTSEDAGKVSLISSAADAVIVENGRLKASVAQHTHCFCGASGSLTGHTHQQDTTWTYITQANADTYFHDRQNSCTGTVNLYLLEDITVTKYINVGTEDTAGDVRLCLNGHTITASGYCAIRIYNGSLSVCDCKGGGKIQVENRANSGTHGAGRVFFFPDSCINDHENGVYPSLDVYGGTFTYGDSCNPSTHGLVYANYHAKVRIYGGTFDGKQKQSSDGAGLITVGNSTEELMIYGGTFQNGSAATKGGAICSGAATTYISGAWFTNNTAPKGVNIALTAGSFSKGTANYKAISVQGTASAQLKNGDLIEKNGTISGSAAFTFENIPINTYLSPEDTNFTSEDAGKVSLISSAADAVIVENGRLKAVPHTHCFCGASGSLTGHTHQQDTTWTYITQANAGSYFKDTQQSQTGTVNLYLLEDITVDKYINVGTTNSAGDVRLCLNGHTITASGYCAIRIYNGSLSVCDCKGGGKIQVENRANSGTHGAGRVFFFPNSVINDPENGVYPSLDVYGGTFTYGDSCNPSTHGLVYANYHAKVRIYGGTFDGKQKQSSDGAGLITVGNSTEELKIYGGIFQNGSAATKGGAICSGAATTYISGARFTNNTAPKGVNIALTAGSFSKGTANYEAISVQGTASAQLKNGDLIEKNGTISSSAAFTFENIPINTYLSPKDTNFTSADAGKVSLISSAANTVIAENGRLKAISNPSMNYLWEDGGAGERALMVLERNGSLDVGGAEGLSNVEIDLNGGTLRLDGSDPMFHMTNVAVTSSEYGGKLVLQNMDDALVKSIVTEIADNNRALAAENLCLPILSEKTAAGCTYTMCKLGSRGMWCPAPVKVAEGSYKFRMMPKFASQTAYDILKNASSEDVITVGFHISATHNGEAVSIANPNNNTMGTSLNCNFTLENAKQFFAAAKDSSVFFAMVSGLEEGFVVIVKPYIMINGHIVYQGSNGSEIAVLDLT